LRQQIGAQPTNGDWDAHHIVSTGFKNRGAPPSQQGAFVCKIEPNDRPNGIYLLGPDLRPGSSAQRNLPDEFRGRAYHPSLHTSDYFEALARQFAPLVNGRSCNNSSARSVISAIGLRLASDDFPSVDYTRERVANADIIADTD
jgi:hypothetical protein